MGARFTAFENTTGGEMEIRVFIPPDRPGRYRRIIRIKPGETKKVRISTLCREETDPENPMLLKVFMDGTDIGSSLLKFEVVTYAKIVGYVNDTTGLVDLKFFRSILPAFSCRLNGCGLSMGKKDSGLGKGEIWELIAGLENRIATLEQFSKTNASSFFHKEGVGL